MKKNIKGIILNNQKIATDCYKISINTELKEAFAGQFISIVCPNKTFARPFSIADFNQGVITVLFKLKGEGTKYIKSLKVADEVSLYAPLGNGFEIENKKSLLIGAGIGVAPMLFLKKSLNENNISNFLVSGFKADDEVISGSDKNIVGNSVLDEIENIIEEFKPERIYSCGPEIVLKTVSEIAKKHSIVCYIAKEKVMACNMGVCRGCVIQIKKDGKILNKTVCKDGPVFLSDEVVWN